jgi:hypothetical protein
MVTLAGFGAPAQALNTSAMAANMTTTLLTRDFHLSSWFSLDYNRASSGCLSGGGKELL